VVASKPRIGTTATIATAATVVGYLSSVLQQFVVGRILGVGADVDALAATMAWSAGVTGFAGTTLASVVIPAYVLRARTDEKGANRLFAAAAAVALGFAVASALIVLLFPRAVGNALLPGSSTSQLANLLQLSGALQITWISVIVATALANAQGRYVAAALTSVIPSAAVIAALLIGPTVDTVIVGYTIGFAGQLAVLLWKTRIPWTSIDFRALDPLRRLVVPIGIGFAFINISNVVVRAVASGGATGDVAVFDYASRLTTAAESVLTAGGLAVLLTIWSGDPRSLRLTPVLVVTVVGSAIAATFVFLFAGPIVNFVYRGGKFTMEDATRVADTLRWLSVAMAARIVHMVALRALLARQDGRAVAVVGVVALGTVTAATYTASSVGLTAITAGYSIAWLFGAGVTVVLAYRAAR